MSNHSTEDRPDDVIESIPWESLGRVDPPDRRPWYIAGAVIVVIVAISASATRTLWPAPPLQVPVATTGTVSVAQPLPAPTTTVVTATVVPAPMLSEADLMAVEPQGLERWVASQAEWFLSELFTLDGSSREDLAHLAPDGVSVGPSDPDARSFVESASTRTVTRTGPDRYDVVVLVRLLSSADGTDYVRQPATAFTVPVGIVDGRPVILDLPSPVEVEFSRAPGPGGDPTEPPAPVIEAAIASAEAFGAVDPSTVTARRSGGNWRVAVEVHDAAGVPWPVVVWVDAEGRALEGAPGQP